MEGLTLILIIETFIFGWFAFQFISWMRLLVKAYIKVNGLVTIDREGNEKLV